MVQLNAAGVPARCIGCTAYWGCAHLNKQHLTLQPCENLCSNKWQPLNQVSSGLSVTGCWGSRTAVDRLPRTRFVNVCGTSTACANPHHAVWDAMPESNLLVQVQSVADRPWPFLCGAMLSAVAPLSIITDPEQFVIVIIPECVT